MWQFKSGVIWFAIVMLCTIPLGAAAEPIYQTITQEQLLQVATDKINSVLGQGDYEILPPGNIPSIITLPAGALTLSATMPHGIRYYMPTLVQVSIMTDKGYNSTMALSYTIKKYDQVLVAARDIAAGEAFNVNNLRFERHDVGRLAQGYINEMKKLAVYVAKHRIVTGTVINDNIIIKPILISRGQTVTILAKIGAAEVTAAGVAMQNGVLGQRIRVQNPVSRKIIVGQVLDRVTVQVNGY